MKTEALVEEKGVHDVHAHWLRSIPLDGVFG